MDKNKLKTNTITTYISNLKNINRLFFDEEINEDVITKLSDLFQEKTKEIDYHFKILDVPETEVIEKMKIKYTNIGTYNNYLNIIVKIAKLLNVEKPLIFEEFKITSIQDRKNKREYKIIQKNKIISLEEDEIIKILKNKNHFKKPDSKLIYALYTLLPARRCDYRLLKLYDPKIKQDENYNYVYVLNNKIYFIFNEYKTQKKYNKQEFSFDNKLLISIFNNYIKNQNIKPNNLLFMTYCDYKDKKELSSATWGNRVETTFYNVYGVDIGVNDMRHNWANYVNENIAKKSVNEIKETTDYMAHSIETNLTYRRNINVNQNVNVNVNQNVEL